MTKARHSHRDRLNEKASFAVVAVRVLLMISVASVAIYLTRQGWDLISARLKQRALVQSLDQLPHESSPSQAQTNAAPQTRPKEVGANLTQKTPSRVSTTSRVPMERKTILPSLVPEIELISTSDNAFFDPVKSSFGRVLILEFWATWQPNAMERIREAENLLSGYTPRDLRLILVNTEENPNLVKNFISDHEIHSEVALDPDGSAAAVFDVNELPTRILIDKQGNLVRILDGVDDSSLSLVRGEIKTLASGGTLDSNLDSFTVMQLAERSLAAKTDTSETIPNETASWQPPKEKHFHPDELRFKLLNGETYSTSEELAKNEERFDEYAAKSKEGGSRQTTFQHPNGQASLIFSDRGGKLHGPLLSFYDDGMRRAFAYYQFGKRVGTTMIWDESGRPLLMENHRRGVRQGVRSVFRSCGDDCDKSHLWISEEWRSGERVASHVAMNPVTFDRIIFQSPKTRSISLYADTELTLAQTEFEAVSEKFLADETHLASLVHEAYQNLKKEFHQQASARLMASDNRDFSAMSAAASFPFPNFNLTNNRSSSSSFTGRFPAMSCGSSRIRNTGRS